MNLDNLQTFYGLFSQYRFHIPNYQRGYSWEEGQWKALMDDLSTLTNHNDHFTGLLVLHEAKDESLKVKTKGVIKEVYDVVDGQQRLTTIVILLDQLRQAMKETGCSDLIEIANDIIPVYLYESGQGDLLVPKLVLDRNNHDFFFQNILLNQNAQGAEIQSHNNLVNAQIYFRNYFCKKKAELGGDYSAWLESLYEKIANQMKVMVYKLRSEADAGVVFESMNNRGKAPNQLDLVKNYLLFLASKLGSELNHALTESINNTWEIIFKQLTVAKRPGDEETLLQMHWLSVYDHDMKRWNNIGNNKSNLIKKRFSLLDYLNRYEKLYQDLDTYVRTLRNVAVAYADIHMPEDRKDIAFQIFTSDQGCRKEILRSSQKLRRIGNLRAFTPLLLAVRLSFPNDAAKYLEALQLCERYSFRVFNVVERRSSSKEAVLFRLGNWLFNEKISFETMSEEVRRDLLAECSDTLFKNSLAIENAVPWYGKRGLAYFLYEYEEHLFGFNEPVINWQTIHDGGERSIEHILPQNPEETGYWVEHFPAVEERDRLKHQVGNLTLVLASDNSTLGRRPFPEKKGKIGQQGASYANSDLKITRELAGLVDWNPVEMAKRQQRLAEWAQKRWMVEAPPPVPNDALEAHKKWCEQSGFGYEFQKFYDVARKLGLHVKANKWSISYRSPVNYNWNVFAIWTDATRIWFKISFNRFSMFKNLSQERGREIFNNKEGWFLAPGKTADFISRLDTLVKEITGEN